MSSSGRLLLKDGIERFARGKGGVEIRVITFQIGFLQVAGMSDIKWSGRICVSVVQSSHTDDTVIQASNKKSPMPDSLYQAWAIFFRS